MGFILNRIIHLLQPWKWFTPVDEDDLDFEFLEYNKNMDLEKKLNLAFEHRSQRSAFWWYENCPIKPNSGSKKDIQTLHKKFARSLRSKDINIKKKFVSMVLPDIDYNEKGYKSKQDCLNEIMNEYDQTELLVFRKSNELKDVTSPFITLTYWLLFDKNVQIKDVFSFFLKITDSDFEIEANSGKIVRKNISKL